MFWEEEGKKRKPFSTKRKKIEWMLAVGRNPYDSSGKLRFVKTSKCRECKRPLTWGDRTYDFDHKDNNSANNRQTNCYLVCVSCHRKHTVIKKRKVKGFFGETVGYKTIKKKVGYKKPKKKPKTTKKKTSSKKRTTSKSKRTTKKKTTKKRKSNEWSLF